MAGCTLFGHRECPEEIRPIFTEVLVDLIENHNVDLFYVGNQGRFDTIVRGVLQKLQRKYPHIDYAVVLAYIPEKKSKYEDFSDTIVPEGIESVPPPLCHILAKQLDAETFRLYCDLCHSRLGRRIQICARSDKTI